MDYYHTLIARGGKPVGYGQTILATDHQILGHKNNEAQCPPEEKWIGWVKVPFPHPTFVRLPPAPDVEPLQPNRPAPRAELVN